MRQNISLKPGRFGNPIPNQCLLGCGPASKKLVNPCLLTRQFTANSVDTSRQTAVNNYLAVPSVPSFLLFDRRYPDEEYMDYMIWLSSTSHWTPGSVSDSGAAGQVQSSVNKLTVLQNGFQQTDIRSY